jgi:hypothetical protein
MRTARNETHICTGSRELHAHQRSNRPCSKNTDLHDVLPNDIENPLASCVGLIVHAVPTSFGACGEREARVERHATVIGDMVSIGVGID